MRIFITLLLCFSFTASCSAQVPSVETQTNIHQTNINQKRLQTLIASDARTDRHKARDIYRRPLQTLNFMGVEQDMTVVEIWPGGQGGWYRKILEPYITNGNDENEKGRYIPVRSRSPFPGTHPDVPYGEVDMVLVFRAHGFMIYKEPAQKYVDSVFTMLKPGGILGIVDHAGDEAVPQDPKGENGYVNESHFIKLARKAGFELIDTADFNHNPADTKNHPRGVWSLPPTLAGSRANPKARAKYKAIGESDRFTLKFRKPVKLTHFKEFKTTSPN